MPQVARRKKMFDDISSFSEEDVADERVVQREVTVPSATRSAQHVDPAAGDSPASEAAVGQAVGYGDDPSAFMPTLASASHQLTKLEVAGGKDAGHVTMVTCVRVSLSPKESPRAAPLEVQQQHESAPAGIPRPHSAAPVSELAYSTPAWREEVEVAVGLHQAETGIARSRKGRRHLDSRGAGDADVKERNGRADVYGAKDAPPAQYPGREGIEVVECSATRDREESCGTRRRPDESDGWEMCEQYTPASRSRAAASSIEYSREEDVARCSVHADHVHGASGSDEDFPLASYIFPRLNPAFAGTQGSRTSVAPGKRPNVIERGCAYLMVADIRVTSYLVALFISLTLLIVSIPTSQLDIVGGACFTYWGFKDNCDTAAYTITRQLYPCAFIRDHLGVGAAFSIMTLIVYLVNFTAVMIAVCCLAKSPHTISSKSRTVVGVLGCAGLVTQLISWAVVARVYHFHPCVKKELAYGVGFGLNLSSWVINVLGAAVVLSPLIW
ncbi:hypothetical protein LSCM1_03163 [Leishmania martiniquensis]|uniref:Amastin-like protein n=1 Tax=Leishmania martiniquensis TaxID=1580590 RepID=A0A836KQE9_9TRYP|nr:hypothetical protein LSCM1_03163 [Leishmania martiniquensis]